MPILIGFLTNYWKQLAVGLVVVSLSIYIAVIKHQRDVAIFDLKQYKLAVDQQKVDQQLKNAEIVQNLSKEKEKLTTDHFAQLNRIRDYYEKNRTINRTANDGLRKQNADYRERLSELLKTTRLSAESRADSDTNTLEAYTRTLEQACTLTTLDYNSLYEAWMAECNLRGCQ